ncbi:MAG: GNAT family N-acetyltransferase [Pseudomonadota bacterium]
MHTAGPFDRPEWFALLAESGLEPFIIRDEESGAAVALRRVNGRLEALTNWYSFIWRPHAPNSEAGQGGLASIAQRLRGQSHRVTLRPVPDEDGSATRLADAFASAGWRVEVTQCDANHVLEVKGRSFADYWSTRPGQLRATVKRKAKHLSTQIVTVFDDTLWAQYEAIYAASWKPTEGAPNMLRAFAEQEGAAGRLRLGFAFLDDTPIAAQFWTVENGIAYIHKLAHLADRAELSAGTILTATLAEHVIDADQVDLIDFGTGNDRYKADWMERVRPRYQIDCLDMAHPRAWIDLAKLAVSRTRATPFPKLARMPRDS